MTSKCKCSYEIIMAVTSKPASAAASIYTIKQRLTVVDTASSSAIPKVLFIFMAKYTKRVHFSPNEKMWYYTD